MILVNGTGPPTNHTGVRAATLLRLSLSQSSARIPRREIGNSGHQALKQPSAEKLEHDFSLAHDVPALRCKPGI
jgi:hypothetical protein